MTTTFQRIGCDIGHANGHSENYDANIDYNGHHCHPDHNEMIAKVQMERKIVELEDDMKEYWGFYLLKHSHYK